MSSDTPRTDAKLSELAAEYAPPEKQAIPFGILLHEVSDFARQLERELATLQIDGPVIPDGRRDARGNPIPTPMRAVMDDYALAADFEARECARLRRELAEARKDAERHTDALRRIAFMSMHVPAVAGEDGRRSFHASQAWHAISIAARAIDAARVSAPT